MADFVQAHNLKLLLLLFLVFGILTDWNLYDYLPGFRGYAFPYPGKMVERNGYLSGRIGVR